MVVKQLVVLYLNFWNLLLTPVETEEGNEDDCTLVTLLLDELANNSFC